MSRRFHQPRALRVESGPDGQPAWLSWQGRPERVAIGNTWKVGGAWWQGETAGRTYYSLLTLGSRTALVVFHDEASDRWYLEQVVD